MWEVHVVRGLEADGVVPLGGRDEGGGGEELVDPVRQVLPVLSAQRHPGEDLEQ